MKILKSTASAARYPLAIMALAGALAQSTQGGVFLNETFENPLLDPGGWLNNVTFLGGGYLDGVGVDNSRGMQMTGIFYEGGWDAWIAMMYLNPEISGNTGATAANTKVAFDVKTDVFANSLGVGLQSWPGNWYGGSMGFSVGEVPIGMGTPGVFQTIVKSLADPLWGLPSWDPSQKDPFHPDGGTFQVYFQAESWNFGGPGTQFTLTVDNLRFWTVINDLAATPAVLWAPNHKMVDVRLDYTLSDGSGTAPIAFTYLTVASNEPENGLGDGDTGSDWQILNDRHVLLRAERSGTGTGRIYTITVHCLDDFGNESTKDVTVSVPFSQKP